MAYWYEAGHNPGASRQVSFLMDSDSDKNSLPTSTSQGTKQGTDDVLHMPVGKGSTALSIASGKLFILNSSNQWTEFGG